MKRLFSRILLFYIAILAISANLASCQKYSDEDYEGMWQLIEIAQPDGSAPQDVKANGIYWRIQLGILQITCTGMPIESNPGEVTATFSVSENIFHLNAIYNHEREADLLIADPAEATKFNVYGISAPTEDFQIEALTDSRLVLVSPGLRLVFRKF